MNEESLFQFPIYKRDNNAFSITPEVKQKCDKHDIYVYTCNDICAHLSVCMVFQDKISATVTACVP